jgi:hypothetical protein
MRQGREGSLYRMPSQSDYHLGQMRVNSTGNSGSQNRIHT